jgi:type 1 glutamine amidotransferase
VLFGVDEKGYIEAGASNIKGLEALKDADAMVIFARFLDLPDAQMKHIVDFVESGKPVAGLRTSSHAFKIPKGKTYSKFDFKYKGEDYHNGFGEQVLGNTWVGHHGRNHKQGTRILLEASQKKHPVLRGVEDNAFCHAGGYVGIAGDDFTVLAKSQPLVSMDPKAAADPKKAAMPSAWVRHYKGKNGQKGRVFHSTQGASEDLLDASYRRLVINGVFWINGLEDAIKADNKVDFVGPYKPSTFKFGGHVKGVKPTDLQDYDSPIMPQK